MLKTDLVELAPVVLFVYNRPLHTKKTLDALAANELALQSELFIYIDGVKPGTTEQEILNIRNVEAIVNAEKRFKKVNVHCSPANKGLAVSVINGVTEIVSRYDKIIVLEDDLVTSPGFLRFMNDALEMYQNENDVACISGYIYPVARPLPETFFIKGADCWGWATWSRAWQIFEPDGQLLLDKLKQTGQMDDFDFNSCYPYSKMLQEQIDGKNNSWAIRWYASAYLNNQFTLYPGVSYLRNIGFDGSGTHSGKKNFWNSNSLNEKALSVKIEVIEDKNAKAIIAEYFKAIQTKPLIRRALVMANKLLNRFK